MCNIIKSLCNWYYYKRNLGKGGKFDVSEETIQATIRAFSAEIARQHAQGTRSYEIEFRKEDFYQVHLVAAHQFRNHGWKLELIDKFEGCGKEYVSTRMIFSPPEAAQTSELFDHLPIQTSWLKESIKEIVRNSHTKAARKQEARDRRNREKSARQAHQIICGLPGAIQRTIKRNNLPFEFCVMSLDPSDNFVHSVSREDVTSNVLEGDLTQMARLVLDELRLSGLKPRLRYFQVSPPGAPPHRYKLGIFIPVCAN